MSRRLHLECHSGVSGDMLLGALVDLGCPLNRLNDAISALKIDGLSLSAGAVVKSGITATKVDVTITTERRLRHFTEVRDILNAAPLSKSVRETALSAIRAIAEAEAKIHNSSLEKVHFHEIGSLDTIADVVGVAAALEYLAPDEITVSPIAVGGGAVTIAHGSVPNPAPATLELLQGFALDLTPLDGERATPTGAALLKTIVTPGATATVAVARAVGYGAGSADFTDRVNVVRAQLFEISAEPWVRDSVTELQATIDDMNPQIFGHLFQRLYAAGALEAFVTPVQMKKQRSGHNLTVIAPPDRCEALAELILRETTSAGVRFGQLRRLTTARESIEVETPYGVAQVKRLILPGGDRFQPEYDSCVQLARASGQPLLEVMRAAQAAAEAATAANAERTRR
ncbi:MAG TPA: nickel pincer cofactor biosynthesis protein LarC [candidate division Zixibacteria bacterium]|nr:nickel pincer cofactor biosynthesis protein LarC [candidate division Zixibacteria bacterium]